MKFSLPTRGPRPAVRRVGAALGLLLLAAPLAPAQTVYGLGTVTMNYLGNVAGTQGFVAIDAGTGVAIGSPTQVTGLPTSQLLVGFDFRPANGQLYALGYDTLLAAPAANARLYTLSLVTGAATPVGPAVRLALGGSFIGRRIGFDFNPVADLVRVVGLNGTSYRLSPATGALVGTDGSLAYASGGPATAGVEAVAYTNAFAGATSTTLYALDVLNSGQLAVVSPPNAGTLTAPVPVLFGAFGMGAPRALDFDIYANAATNRNEAFLTEVTATGSSNFYRLNLATGQATLVGNTVPRVVPFEIRDLAVAIGGPLLATAPAALARLASVYPNPATGTATLLLPAALRQGQATAVQVLDNVGRVVLARTLAAGAADELALPLGTLAPGLYLVQAHTAAGLVARPLAVR